jgi:hypothetical protein
MKEDGGQKVIKEFNKNGHNLYTTAPVGLDPLGKVSGLLGSVHKRDIPK